MQSLIDWKKFYAKLIKLLRGDVNDFSKCIKIMQYVSVITSEFDLYQYHPRGLYYSDPALDEGSNAKQCKELKARWKATGSALSTARMTMRAGNALGPLLDLLVLLKDFGNTIRSKRGCLNVVCQIVDIFGCIFDNWVWLKRIGMVKYRTEWQENWVDWLSSACTLSVINMHIWLKISKIWKATVT